MLNRAKFGGEVEQMGAEDDREFDRPLRREAWDRRRAAQDAIRRDLGTIFKDAENQRPASPEALVRSLSPVPFRARRGLAGLSAMPVFLGFAVLASVLMAGTMLPASGAHDAVPAADAAFAAPVAARSAFPAIAKGRSGASDRSRIASPAPVADRACKTQGYADPRRCPRAAVVAGGRAPGEAYADAIRN